MSGHKEEDMQSQYIDSFFFAVDECQQFFHTIASQSSASSNNPLLQIGEGFFICIGDEKGKDYTLEFLSQSSTAKRMQNQNEENKRAKFETNTSITRNNHQIYHFPWLSDHRKSQKLLHISKNHTSFMPTGNLPLSTISVNVPIQTSNKNHQHHLDRMTLLSIPSYLLNDKLTSESCQWFFNNNHSAAINEYILNATGLEYSLAYLLRHNLTHGATGILLTLSYTTLLSTPIDAITQSIAQLQQLHSLLFNFTSVIKHKKETTNNHKKMKVLFLVSNVPKNVYREDVRHVLREGSRSYLSTLTTSNFSLHMPFFTSASSIQEWGEWWMQSLVQQVEILPVLSPSSPVPTDPSHRSTKDTDDIGLSILQKMQHMVANSVPLQVQFPGLNVSFHMSIYLQTLFATYIYPYYVQSRLNMTSSQQYSTSHIIEIWSKERFLWQELSTLWAQSEGLLLQCKDNLEKEIMMWWISLAEKQLAAFDNDEDGEEEYDNFNYDNNNSKSLNSNDYDLNSECLAHNAQDNSTRMNSTSRSPNVGETDNEHTDTVSATDHFAAQGTHSLHILEEEDARQRQIANLLKEQKENRWQQSFASIQSIAFTLFPSDTDNSANSHVHNRYSDSDYRYQQVSASQTWHLIAQHILQHHHSRHSTSKQHQRHCDRLTRQLTAANRSLHQLTEKYAQIRDTLRMRQMHASLVQATPMEDTNVVKALHQELHANSNNNTTYNSTINIGSSNHIDDSSSNNNRNTATNSMNDHSRSNSFTSEHTHNVSVVSTSSKTTTTSTETKGNNSSEKNNKAKPRQSLLKRMFSPQRFLNSFASSNDVHNGTNVPIQKNATNDTNHIKNNSNHSESEPYVDYAVVYKNNTDVQAENIHTQNKSTDNSNNSIMNADHSNDKNNTDEKDYKSTNSITSSNDNTDRDKETTKSLSQRKLPTSSLLSSLITLSMDEELHNDHVLSLHVPHHDNANNNNNSDATQTLQEMSSPEYDHLRALTMMEFSPMAFTPITSSTKQVKFVFPSDSDLDSVKGDKEEEKGKMENVVEAEVETHTGHSPIAEKKTETAEDQPQSQHKSQPYQFKALSSLVSTIQNSIISPKASATFNSQRTLHTGNNPSHNTTNGVNRDTIRPKNKNPKNLFIETTLSPLTPVRDHQHNNNNNIRFTSPLNPGALLSPPISNNNKNNTTIQKKIHTHPIRQPSPSKSATHQLSGQMLNSHPAPLSLRITDNNNALHRTYSTNPQKRALVSAVQTAMHAQSQPPMHALLTRHTTNTSPAVSVYPIATNKNNTLSATVPATSPPATATSLANHPSLGHKPVILANQHTVPAKTISNNTTHNNITAKNATNNMKNADNAINNTNNMTFTHNNVPVASVMQPIPSVPVNLALPSAAEIAQLPYEAQIAYYTTLHQQRQILQRQQQQLQQLQQLQQRQTQSPTQLYPPMNLHLLPPPPLPFPTTTQMPLSQNRIPLAKALTEPLPQPQTQRIFQHSSSTYEPAVMRAASPTSTISSMPSNYPGSTQPEREEGMFPSEQKIKPLGNTSVSFSPEVSYREHDDIHHHDLIAAEEGNREEEKQCLSIKIGHAVPKKIVLGSGYSYNAKRQKLSSMQQKHQHNDKRK